jgi:hypothetical protein
VKNILYRRTDDVERLQKVIDDSDRQLIDCLQQVKTLGEENEHLKAAAQQVLDAVEPQGGLATTSATLAERLRGAPQKILSIITETTVEYVSHALGLFKSFWPEAQLGVLAEGKASDCSEEEFLEYRRETEPLAEKIVKSLEQE